MFFFLYLFLSVRTALSNDDCLPLNVTTAQGKVRGRCDGESNIIIFKSVPYAEPPLGENRFATTLPPKNYTNGEYDAAANIQKACMQPFGPEFMDEDCLYLDVYTPRVPSEEPQGYPVVVWIHGGAYVTGTKELYNLTSFAQHGVVAIAINYRLGIWAYLRVHQTAPANYAFLDQIQALKWVRENIKQFGGDPNRVTIQGQSAGADIQLLHLVSPLSKGLFHRAFMLSGGGGGGDHVWTTAEDANVTATIFSTLLGCPAYNATCIRDAPTSQVYNTTLIYMGLCMFSNQTLFEHYNYNREKISYYCGLAPESGSDVLPANPFEALQNGEIQNSVPIIRGIVWNEGTFYRDGTFSGIPLKDQAAQFYQTDSLEKTEGVYKNFLNEIVDHKSYKDNSSSYLILFSDRAKQIYDKYPYNRSDANFIDMYPYGYNEIKGSPLDANYVYDALHHDKNYHCSAYSFMISLQTAFGNNSPRIYMYRFMQPSKLNQDLYQEAYNSDPNVAVEHGFFSQNLYPSHMDDIPFFLNNKEALKSDSDAKLSERMFSANVNFIHTGSPNEGPFEASVGVKWPEFKSRERNLIWLSEPSAYPTEIKNSRGDLCDFWEDIGGRF
jgi:carboxylesterase type B